eukprot:118035-Hanusia_phi.AAC.1
MAEGVQQICRVIPRLPRILISWHMQAKRENKEKKRRRLCKDSKAIRTRQQERIDNVERPDP